MIIMKFLHNAIFISNIKARGKGVLLRCRVKCYPTVQLFVWTNSSTSSLLPFLGSLRLWNASCKDCHISRWKPQKRKSRDERGKV